MTQFEDRMAFFDFVCHMTMNDCGSFNFSWDKEKGRIAYIEGSWQKVEVLNSLFNEHLNKSSPINKNKMSITRQDSEELNDVLKGDEVASTSIPPQLTFGQKLVGLTFNPSGDEKVNKAKMLCADLADLLHDEMTSRERSGLSASLYEHTIGEILNAQMNVVKVLTLKY